MAATDIFSGFSGFTGMKQVGVYIGYGIIFLICMLVLAALILWLVVKSKDKMIIELDLVTKRFKKLSGRERKMKSGKRHIWVSKYKKFIPQIQAEDMYLQGKKDVILLIKDNNGLHHTARLPNMEELADWYKKAYEIDINDIQQEAQELNDAPKETIFDKIKNKFQKNSVVEEKKKLAKILNTIYLMPNPAEDLDWLSAQAIEADREFSPEWWKSPVVMVIGTVALCIFLVIITLIIEKKM